MKKVFLFATIIASVLAACEPNENQGPINNGTENGGSTENGGTNEDNGNGNNGSTEENAIDYEKALVGHWWNVDSIYTDDDSLYYDERISFSGDGEVVFVSAYYVNDYEEEYECVGKGEWSISKSNSSIIDIEYNDVSVYCSEGKQEYCGFEDEKTKDCSYEIMDAYFDEDGEITNRKINVVKIKFDDGNVKTFSLYSTDFK